MEHGQVTPTYGYVLNVFIDDGSDSIRGVFFRDVVLSLVEKTDADMQGFREKPEQFEQIKTALLGETIKVIGRVSKNQMFERLEVMASKVFVNIDRYGNTSAASIPIALCEAFEQERAKIGDTLAFVAFGAGLTWASAVVKIGEPAAPIPVERSWLSKPAWLTLDPLLGVTRTTSSNVIRIA